MNEVTCLDNGSTSHTDSLGNTLTGSPRFFIGNNAPSGDDSALLIGRGLSGSYSSGAHAVRDETIYSAWGAGLLAFCSFDSNVEMTGTADMNHLHSFQARPAYSGTGQIGQVAGLVVQANMVANCGQAYYLRGMRYSDPQGTGPVRVQAALWVDSLTRASGGNFSLYSIGPTTGLYNAGPVQFGSTLSIPTPAIITSDLRAKEQIAYLTDAERAVAKRLKGLIRTFKFKDAVAEKGEDAARTHVGVIAQDVKAVFEAEGLCAEKYAILCYEEWEETPERAAGNQYGVRYEELLSFIIAAI